MSPERDDDETQSPVVFTNAEPELITSRPVLELKIKGAAISKSGSGRHQITSQPSPVVEDSKIQSTHLRRDDEDASSLMQRIRQMLIQRDGIRSAEKRIAEEGLIPSISKAGEPKSTAADTETSKKSAKEKLLAKLQAEKALLQPTPRANMELEGMEKRLKAQAKLRIKLAREKGAAIASGSVTTGIGMDGTAAGGVSIRGAASAAATEQNLRAKLLSRRNDVAY